MALSSRALLVLLVTAMHHRPVLPTTTSQVDMAVCEDDWGCSLGGRCTPAGQCDCDQGFEGQTCARLAFRPAPSIGHAFRPGHGFTTWGGSPIQADNRSMYYLFASVNLHGTLADW